MGKTLYLEKRGADFSTHEPELLKNSDVENYRLDTPARTITGKNGKVYYLEFSLWRNRGHIRYISKYGNKTLKHPVFEIDIPYALHIDTEFEKKDGSCYRDLNLEKQIHDHMYTYTRENILKAVNEISTVQYNKLMLVATIDSIEAIPEILKQAGNREKYVISNLYETDHIEYNKDHYLVKYRTFDGHGFVYDLKQHKIIG